MERREEKARMEKGSFSSERTCVSGRKLAISCRKWNQCEAACLGYGQSQWECGGGLA